MLREAATDWSNEGWRRLTHPFATPAAGEHKGTEARRRLPPTLLLAVGKPYYHPDGLTAACATKLGVAVGSTGARGWNKTT